jgi:hypothetical protein
MDVNQMRELLYTAYPGQKWSDKVKKMTDDQVTAVFLRLRAQKKI